MASKEHLEKRLKELNLKLDNCPFCKSLAEIVEYEYELPTIHCTNDDCYAEMIDDIDIDNDEELIAFVEKWNRRA